MQALREFVIPFKGLKPGSHYYEFEVGEDFFTQFAYSHIKRGKFKVELHLNRRQDLMILEFDFEGNLTADCDRCLNQIEVPMKGNHRIMVKMSEDLISEEELVSISPMQSELNVAPFVYEMIHLNLPLKNIRDCESENFKYCNRTVLDSIDRHVNEEGEGSMWEELKKIKWK